MMTLALLESEKKTKADLQFGLVALQEEQKAAIYVLIKIDKQGQVQLLDNNAPIERNHRIWTAREPYIDLSSGGRSDNI